MTFALKESALKESVKELMFGQRSMPKSITRTGFQLGMGQAEINHLSDLIDNENFDAGRVYRNSETGGPDSYVSNDGQRRLVVDEIIESLNRAGSAFCAVYHHLSQMDPEAMAEIMRSVRCQVAGAMRTFERCAERFPDLKGEGDRAVAVHVKTYGKSFDPYSRMKDIMEIMGESR